MSVDCSPPHILAINNDQSVLDLFHDLLAEEGYRVTVQAYADKDLDAIVALAPDLIVLDYMWANDDSGWALLQLLRMDRRTATIPIVLCTAARKEVEAISAHLREMKVRVVLKPFAIDALLAAVADGLAREGGAALEGSKPSE